MQNHNQINQSSQGTYTFIFELPTYVFFTLDVDFDINVTIVKLIL